VLSVNAAGQATALSAGNAAVTADFQGVTSAPVNVLVIALTTINLTFAPAPTVNVGDAGLQFTATGIFSDGSNQDLTNLATYASTRPAVLTVNATGQATALTAGTSDVTVTWASPAPRSPSRSVPPSPGCWSSTAPTSIPCF
jgi:hypothetical protein